jgi:hypothetical protein
MAGPIKFNLRCPTKEEICIFLGIYHLLSGIVYTGQLLFILFQAEKNYQEFRNLNGVNASLEHNEFQATHEACYPVIAQVLLGTMLLFGILSIIINAIFIIGCFKKDTCLIMTWVLYQTLTGGTKLIGRVYLVVHFGQGTGAMACNLLIMLVNIITFISCYIYLPLSVRREIINSKDVRAQLIQPTKKINIIEAV